MSSRFLPLTVKDVRKTARDAVAVTLEPDDPDRFRFEPGQYLTFRREFDGEELRRNYSICSGLDDDPLQVGIRRVEGGAFSTWANEKLAPGERLEAMPPAGKFVAPIEPDARRDYLSFAGGAGITPILSILRAVLAREPASRFTLVYANRAVSTIMFREELEDLKNRHLGRLNVVHVLEQDALEIELFTGRVDGAKCEELFERWIEPADADLALICGPEPMMRAVADSLRACGLEDDRIKFELFASNQPGRLPLQSRARPDGKKNRSCEAFITLDGATRTVSMPNSGQSLLEAALAADIDAPHACTAGVCSTCRARVTEGEVEMIANHALEDHEVSDGYVLTCQSYPLTNKVRVDYDQ